MTVWWWQPGRYRRLGTATVLAGALALALLPVWLPSVLARASVLLEWPPVVLDTQSRSWQVTLPSARDPRRVAVVASLASSGELADATPVALVRWRGSDGGVLEAPLRLGHELAEWSSAPAARPAPGAPRPWLVLVDDASQTFAAHYRSAVLTVPAGSAGELEIVRAPRLPRRLTVTLHQVTALPAPRLLAERRE
jgi:hypothetical protein